MNEMQIFNNDEFGDVRTIVIDGEIWFVGRDVAAALGYAKPENAVRDRVRERDTLKRGISDGNGQHTQQTLIINESGLYRLIFGSKLESAERFQDWVTHDVLPSIRKTGSYQTPQTVPQQIQLLAQGYVELEKKVDGVASNVETMKTDIQTMKDDMPMFPAELEQITKAVRKKGVEVMGGGDSPAYHDRGLCATVYRDIYSEIHRNFGVDSYKLIRRSECGLVISIVDNYRLPMILADRVMSKNAAA